MRRVGGSTAGLVGCASLAIALAGCEGGSSSAPERRTDDAASTSSSSSEADASRPVPQGFTQPPPRDASWLPPPPAPLLTPQELAHRERKRDADAVSPAATERAWSEIEDLLEAVAAEADAGRPIAPLVSALRERARRAILREGLGYVPASELHEEFLFPNDAAAAEARHHGRPIVIEGRVAPENMLDPADGFKLFEREPYVHEPVLLSTDYEFTFVRCHLLRPAAQKLRDWEEVHVLGIVDGKKKSDVVLRRCVVL